MPNAAGVWEWGSPGRETFVMLHSLGLDGAAFHWLAKELLARATLRVVALDMLGHGRFSEVCDEISIQAMAHDVNRRLEGLGIRRAHLLGTSMGSAVARFAVMQAPGRWESVTLVAGGPAAVPAVAERGQTAVEQGMAAIIPATIERWFSRAEIECNPDYLVYARTTLAAMRPASWRASWQALAGYPAAPQIPSGLPGLCIAGELDASTPPTTVGEMRIHAGILTPLCIVDGGGHQLLMSHPAMAADLIAGHLKAKVGNVPGSGLGS